MKLYCRTFSALQQFFIFKQLRFIFRAEVDSSSADQNLQRAKDKIKSETDIAQAEAKNDLGKDPEKFFQGVKGKIKTIETSSERAINNSSGNDKKFVDELHVFAEGARKEVSELQNQYEMKQQFLAISTSINISLDKGQSVLNLAQNLRHESELSTIESALADLSEQGNSLKRLEPFIIAAVPEFSGNIHDLFGKISSLEVDLEKARQEIKGQDEVGKNGSIAYNGERFVDPNQDIKDLLEP